MGNYHFSEFQLDKEYVYVLEEDNYFREEIVQRIKTELEKNGFEKTIYENFLIYTYPE